MNPRQVTAQPLCGKENDKNKKEKSNRSSAKAYIAGTADPLLHGHSWFSPQEQPAYSEFASMADEQIDNAIRKATRTGRPFGSESFIDRLELQLNQSLKPGKPGRPRKTMQKTGEFPQF